MNLSQSPTRPALLALLVVLLPWSVAADPQPEAAWNPERGDWSTHAGIGVASSPGGFLASAGVEYAATPALGVGPLVQFVVDDDTLIVAPTANARYRFDLSHLEDDVLSRLEPFVQGGLGLAWVEKDRPGRDRDDTEFLMNGGFGVDYAVSERFSIGSGVLFNGMPVDDAAGEDFFVSWQLLNARLRF